MQVRKLLREDDAVSPVIGVILMVAITVILAAVIASFVLGLGGSQQQTPQASFSWDFEERGDANGGDGIVRGTTEVSHNGGDTITATELQFRGNGFLNDNDLDDDGNSETINGIRAASNWPENQTSGESGGNSAVTGGDTVEIAVTSDYELSLVWEPSEGDTSATLSEETGPDA